MQNVREKKLYEIVDGFLTEERASVNTSIDSVKSMLSSKNDMCYSYYLNDIFEKTKFACSGCPSCRKNEFEKVKSEITLEIENYQYHKDYTPMSFMSNFSVYSNYDSRGLFYYENELSKEELNKAITKFINAGINIIVTQNITEDILSDLKYVDFNNYILLNYEEFELIKQYYCFGSICFFIPTDEKMKKKYLKVSNKIVENSNIGTHILVGRADLYDELDRRYVRDYVEYSINLKDALREDVIC